MVNAFTSQARSKLWVAFLFVSQYSRSVPFQVSDLKWLECYYMRRAEGSKRSLEQHIYLRR